MSARHELTPMVARAEAPAKINPLLDVLHARPDGYHELRTFLVALDLSDVVEARADDRATVSLVLGGPHASADIPASPRNLACGAAAACLQLARELGVADARSGVELRLEKNIPSQAGLGGASSDAAAAWAATASLLGVEHADGHDLARDRALARLGSDTLFFARASATGAAWCTGRGEIVAPTPAPRGWSIALVTPALAAPTARVYAAFEKRLRDADAVPTLEPVDWSSLPALSARARLGNRLEPAALFAIDGLRDWRRLLDDAGAAHFLLSGSGSSFFGLYDDDSAARADLQLIARLSQSRGLASRFCDIVHPCGHGARVLTEA